MFVGNKAVEFSFKTCLFYLETRKVNDRTLPQTFSKNSILEELKRLNISTYILQVCRYFDGLLPRKQRPLLRLDFLIKFKLRRRPNAVENTTRAHLLSAYTVAPRAGQRLHYTGRAVSAGRFGWGPLPT